MKSYSVLTASLISLFFACFSIYCLFIHLPLYFLICLPVAAFIWLRANKAEDSFNLLIGELTIATISAQAQGRQMEEEEDERIIGFRNSKVKEAYYTPDADFLPETEEEEYIEEDTTSSLHRKRLSNTRIGFRKSSST